MRALDMGTTNMEDGRAFDNQPKIKKSVTLTNAL